MSWKFRCANCRDSRVPWRAFAQGAIRRACSADCTSRYTSDQSAMTLPKRSNVIQRDSATAGQPIAPRGSLDPTRAIAGDARHARRRSPANKRRALLQRPIRTRIQSARVRAAERATGWSGHLRTWMCAVSPSWMCRRSRCGPRNPVARSARSAPSASDLDHARSHAAPRAPRPRRLQPQPHRLSMIVCSLPIQNVERAKSMKLRSSATKLAPAAMVSGAELARARSDHASAWPR